MANKSLHALVQLYKDPRNLRDLYYYWHLNALSALLVTKALPEKLFKQCYLVPRVSSSMQVQL